MPNPLLVMGPMTKIGKDGKVKPSNPPSHPVGTLLVKTWGSGKLVQSKVCRVVKVHRHVQGAGKWKDVYYTYDVKWASGNIEEDVYEDRYIPFSEYRGRLKKKIECTNKVLTNQYKALNESEKMEEEAKKLFDVRD